MKQSSLSTIKGLLDKTLKGIQSLKKREKKKKEESRAFLRKERSEGVQIVKDGDVMKVEIAPSSVAKGTVTILAVLAFAFFLLQIGSILLLFFLAFLFTAGLDHTVTRLQKRWKIPRALSVVILYILILSVLAVTVSSLAPLVAEQITALVAKSTEFINNVAEGKVDFPFADKLAPYFQDLRAGVDFEAFSNDTKEAISQFATELLNVGDNIVKVLLVIFSSFFNITMVLVLTFFMVVEWANIEDFFISLFPSKHTKYIVSHLDAVKLKIGYWLRGQLFLSLCIGVLTFVGLLIINMDYALTLALIAALTELIPVIGPIIALLIAIPVAANISFGAFISVIILFIIIQQIEGNVLVPIVMKKAVGLSPLIIIFAMLVGYQFVGIIGVIIAVPVAASISIFVREYSQKTR